MNKRSLSGTADVFREPDCLGTVRYDFQVTPDGRVSGSIVHIGRRTLHPAAGTVPVTFLLQRPLSGHDLTLTLPDGRRVGFTVPYTDGEIANGRIAQSETWER